MEEEFQYTNKFLRDNKDFILSILYRDNWEMDENWSIEQKMQLHLVVMWHLC